MWLDGNFEWGQDGSSYKVVRFRDKPVSETWPENHLFDAAGAARDIKGARYPSDFNFSPYDRSKLTHAEPVSASSLPPYAQIPAANNRQGYPETAHHIEIADVESVTLPSRSLPLPSKGRHHFLVGNFGLKRPFLLSIDLASGEFHCWIDEHTGGDGRWAAIRPENEICIAAFTGPDTSWSMHASDLNQSGAMYFPTDIGLARIEVNVLALSYSIQYLAPDKQSLSGVIRFNNKICCLIKDGERIGVLSVADGDAPRTTHYDLYDIEGLASNDLGIIRLPFIARGCVYWLCKTGQIRLAKKPTTGSYQAKITPWPSDTTPCLQLGAPYESPDGATWFQCFHQGSSKYYFILLGDKRDERPVSRKCRLMGARSFFELGSPLRNEGPPWDPVVESAKSDQRLLVPLIESTSGKRVMICWTHKQWQIQHEPMEFFDNTKKAFLVGFNLIGHLDEAKNKLSREYSDANLVTPWDTRVVIYDNVLYQYDPDSEAVMGRGVMMGWVLAT